MDENRICFRSAKCPIYAGILESREALIRVYRQKYCDNGKEGHEKCKRFQVAAIVGSCPPNLLPNNHHSVEEIIKKMKQKG
jgi:hypothetical protein